MTRLRFNMYSEIFEIEYSEFEKFNIFKREEFSDTIFFTLKERITMSVNKNLFYSVQREYRISKYLELSE